MIRPGLRVALLAGLIAAAAPACRRSSSTRSARRPAPGSGALPEGGIGEDDALTLPWLDGGEGGDPAPADSGVAIGPGRPGQNGVLIERFPGTSAPVTSVSQPVTRRARASRSGRSTACWGVPRISSSIGQTVLFGRIAINVPECRYPAENPSSDAFAHIRVLDTGGNMLFDGWMVASSPALSALEHPRYDVWVLRCTSTS
jgi:hypothetical protein